MMNAGSTRVVAVKHEHHHQIDDAWEAERRDQMNAPFDARDPWKEEVIELLNDSLTPELVCVLRYRSSQEHYHPQPDVRRGGGEDDSLTDEALAQVTDAQARADLIADRIANRIVDRVMQIQARAADSEPAELHHEWRDSQHHEERAEDDAGDVHNLMYQADPLARLVMENHRHGPTLMGDKDPAMRRMREDREHADDWLAR